MAIPTQRQIAKRQRKKAYYEEKNEEPKIENKPISEEEHRKRLELLKNIGLLN